MADSSRLGPALAALSAITARRWELGPATNKVSAERGVAVRMRDGAVLLADHYAPVTSGPRPTVLMRCPYGRGLVYAMPALLYAERGYHVLLQSCRGTSGSGGTFRPYADEAPDGQDTVGWLRGQDWFDGRLATVGASYLAYVQWALALDPPPELRAMVVQVSPHDLGASCFGHGPFELYNRLAWSEMMAHQEQLGPVRWVWRAVRANKRLAPMLAGPVHVAGVPSVRLHVSHDGACADIFTRLCDVDGRGRSRDLTDQIIRLGPAGPADGGTHSVSLPLTGVSHVFQPGHRIRLQVSGGAFPRHARNLGTAGDPITGTQTAPVSYRVFHSGPRPSAITMPVLAPAREVGEGSIPDGDGTQARETSR